MSKKIKTWHFSYEIYRNGPIEVPNELTLYDDKIVHDYTYNGTAKHYEYTPIDYFKGGNYPQNDLCLYELYKLITKAACPPDVDARTRNKWLYWQAFEADRVLVEKLWLDEAQEEFYHYTPYSIGCRRSNWQTFEQFFFNGPRKEGLPLEVRQKMRQISFQALAPNKHNFTLKDDAFPLFDYNKITPMEWSLGDSKRGEKLGLKGGYFSYGTWEPNPRNSGGGTSSIESYWLDLEKQIPSNFRQYIAEIRANLAGALVEDY